MDKKMFCFQCEQTAGCSGCTGAAGVCGKDAETSELQDRLTGALISLARSTEGSRPLDSTDRAMLSGLFTTITNVNFNPETIRQQIGWCTGRRKISAFLRGMFLTLRKKR